MTVFRTLLLAAAIVALGAPAGAQDMMQEAMRSMAGKQQHQGTQKQADKQQKKKVDENAYNEALKSIPDASKKTDPWGKLR